MAGPVVCTPEISIEKFNAGFPITGPLELVKLNTIQDCVALAGVMVSETCSPLIVVGVPSVAVVAAKSVGKLVPLTLNVLPSANTGSARPCAAQATSDTAAAASKSSLLRDTNVMPPSPPAA